MAYWVAENLLHYSLRFCVEKNYSSILHAHCSHLMGNLNIHSTMLTFLLHRNPPTTVAHMATDILTSPLCLINSRRAYCSHILQNPTIEIYGTLPLKLPPDGQFSGRTLFGPQDAPRMNFSRFHFYCTQMCFFWYLWQDFVHVAKEGREFLGPCCSMCEGRGDHKVVSAAPHRAHWVLQFDEILRVEIHLKNADAGIATPQERKILPRW